MQRSRSDARWVVRADGCWAWLGGRCGKNGEYGKGSRTQTTAHREVYEELVGPIPDGMQLDHVCELKTCVNPAHVEAVTPLENLRRAGLSKLSVEQTAEIRRRVANGEKSRDLASEFGVTYRQVRYIVAGRTRR